MFAFPLIHDNFKILIKNDGNLIRLIGIVSYLEHIPQNEDKIINEIIKIQRLIAINNQNNTSGTLSLDSKNYTRELVRQSDIIHDMIIGFKGEIKKSIYLGDNFFIDGSIYNVRKNMALSNILVNVEILRNDFVIKEQSLKTMKGGSIHFEFKNLDYPLFYPKLCYDVKIKMSFENKTSVWSDDFVVKYPINNKTWEPNFSLLNDDRFDYLPSDFRQEPRQSYYKDEKCN